MFKVAANGCQSLLSILEYKNESLQILSQIILNIDFAHIYLARQYLS